MKISTLMKVRQVSFSPFVELNKWTYDLPYAERRMFMMAALQEISGKERELATDSECASGLERMAYSMDDFVRRVFMDSLTGS
jgi:hypothetical protein